MGEGGNTVCKYLILLSIKMSEAYSSSKIITFHQEQKENS